MNSDITQQQLKALYENVADVIFYLAVEAEGQYRFLYINKAFLAATGLTSDKVIGKLVTEVIPPPSHALVLTNYSKAITGKETVRWIETSVYPSGTKYGEVSVTPIFNDAGTCTNLLGTVHDITKDKMVSLAMEKKLTELESLNKIMVGREAKMAELKEENERLKKQLGQ